MKQDGRLARMIHVLIHMGLLGGRETSDTIAKMLNTNPVVVRRTMGALRLRGIVKSEGGRGGGWMLQRPLDELTILDVQMALDDGVLLPAGISRDHPSCPVEHATNVALTAAFSSAEVVLRDEFSRQTLAQLAKVALGTQGTSPKTA
jgi:DNA-binding IscR family transcriptional regulator